METRQGKIEAKAMAQAKNGAAYATFTINGSPYNVFDQKIMESFNVGDFVAYTGGNNEKGFWQLKTMDKIAEPQGVVQENTPQKAPTKEFHLSPEQVRTNAFDLALRKEPNGTMEAILVLATEIEEYLWNGNSTI